MDVDDIGIILLKLILEEYVTEFRIECNGGLHSNEYFRYVKRRRLFIGLVIR
jgi:hypothetical protein